MERVVVYTDGACSGNPGPGGWGWAVSPGGEPSGSGGEAHTTNQRMEVYAVLDAIRTLGANGTPIEIVSDSTYVVNCFRDNWWVKWEKNGWKNSGLPWTYEIDPDRMKLPARQSRTFVSGNEHD